MEWEADGPGTLPASELGFPDLHTEDRGQPPRAVVQLSGNCPAQAGVELMIQQRHRCAGVRWDQIGRAHV